MDKDFNFVFIDESITEEINMASLTALIVPLKVYEKLRSDFYKILKYILDELYPVRSSQNHIYLPPVLHANSLLQNSKDNPHFDFTRISDKFRERVLLDIIKILNDNKLFVVRIGYDNYQEIKRIFRKDYKLHSLNWLGLSRTINANLKESILIPVMDGVDPNIVDKFSGLIWSANSYAELYPHMSVSSAYENCQNFYGSVFFAKGSFNECIQIVDIISYLLQKADYIRITGKKSSYSNVMMNVLSTLNNDNLINSIETLRHTSNTTVENAGVEK